MARFQTESLLLFLVLSVTMVSALGTCKQGVNCLLPHCRCASDTDPMEPSRRPQIVYFGFDDAVNIIVSNHYRSLFSADRKNPNGCPISMSLYAQHDYTDYRLVKEFYEAGHEIGVHSVTHTDIDTAAKLKDEAYRQRQNLAIKADVPLSEIVGWRSPNLKTAGDDQPTILQAMGYEYDISLTYTRRELGSSTPWPFTLDFGWPYPCMVTPCPSGTTSHTGFWEVPVNSLIDRKLQYPCPYVDGCYNRPDNAEQAYDFLILNFNDYYQNGRAPFGLHMHAAWFVTPHNLEAMDRFIRKLLTLPDVYIVTTKQMLDWVKNPKSLDELSQLPSWRCKQGNVPRPPLILPQPSPSTPATPKPWTPWRPPTTQEPWTFRPVVTAWRPPVNKQPFLTPTPMVFFTPSPPTTTTPTTTTSTTTPTTTTTTTTMSTTTSTTTRATTARATAVDAWGPTYNWWEAERGATCVQNGNCFLPKCLCRTTGIPADLPRYRTPQMVYFTIDGPIRYQYYQDIINIFSADRKNPNGCRITSTFFVPKEGSYTKDLKNLADMGFEVSMIGNQMQTYSNVEDLEKDLRYQLRFLNHSLDQHDPSKAGWRTPALRPLGDRQFQVLNNQVGYDSSLTLTDISDRSNLPWPYTLDFGWQERCQSSGCPELSHPGFWEVPVVPLRDYKGRFICSYADGCIFNPTTSVETFSFLQENFDQHYNGNRSPFGVSLRLNWFSHPAYHHNIQGLKMFIDYLLTKEDVYVLSVDKVLAWVRQPTPLQLLRYFRPWSC